MARAHRLDVGAHLVEAVDHLVPVDGFAHGRPLCANSRHPVGRFAQPDGLKPTPTRALFIGKSMCLNPSPGSPMSSAGASSKEIATVAEAWCRASLPVRRSCCSECAQSRGHLQTFDEKHRKTRSIEWVGTRGFGQRDDEVVFSVARRDVDLGAGHAPGTVFGLHTAATDGSCLSRRRVR